MIYHAPSADGNGMLKRILLAAARLFLTKGYSQSTVREIAVEAGVDVSAMIRAVKCKENILCHLVAYVLDGMFTISKELSERCGEDPLMYYAAETALQLHMAELSESIRELYSAAYAMPDTSEIIYRYVSAKLEHMFRTYNADWEAKDFFEHEIASGSIMRGYLSRPCDMYFTIDRKVKVFLECSLTIYNVPKDRIAQAVVFTETVDFVSAAQNAVKSMLDFLEKEAAEISPFD